MYHSRMIMKGMKMIVKRMCRVILFSIGPIKWKARHKNEQQKERKASIINFTFSLRIVWNTAKSNIL